MSNLRFTIRSEWDEHMVKLVVTKFRNYSGVSRSDSKAYKNQDSVKGINKDFCDK